MTDPTSDALDGQDTADYAVSRDAMRWTPPATHHDLGHVVDPAWYQEPWAGGGKP